MKEAFTFDDVLIVQQYSEIEGRDKVSLAVSTRKKGLRGFLTKTLPVIAANMDTVTGPSMSRAMLDYGAQACLHRFCSIEDSVKMFLESRVMISPDHEDIFSCPMVSIGLGDHELERAKALYEHGASQFVIDVAHGAQKSVANQAIALRRLIWDNGAIMAGNFSSVNSVKDFLRVAGNSVDGIKIGVGPGSACTTRIKTGVGYPQFSAVQEIASLLSGSLAIIADGGMKTPGDIAKALGAGAHMVMIGGMLAGTDETPGELTYKNTDISDPGYPSMVTIRVDKYKKYRGSASQESYDAQGKSGKHRTAEGESFLVPYKGPVKNILQDIEGGLRSTFTYSGARDLEEFHDRVEFVRVSAATQLENGAHGKR